jgi:hypothetical protein
MIALTILALASAAAVAGAIVVTVRDGYRRIPTRTY